jgi:hypothetical protein
MMNRALEYSPLQSITAVQQDVDSKVVYLLILQVYPAGRVFILGRSGTGTVRL